MKPSILLADDSATIRKVVELTCGDSGYRVDAVASGAEAIERLGRTTPDLVLADAVMPAPDGYELCRFVKGSERPVPVLLLSGTFERYDPERAHRCGADGHLRKPFESSALLAEIERLIRTEPTTLAPPDELPGGTATTWPPETLDALARAVVERVGAETFRELAREILPRVAEQVVRERIREIEAEDDSTSGEG